MDDRMISPKRTVPLSVVSANDEGRFSSARAHDSDSATAYLGDFLGLFAGYAADPRDRSRVASGGLVTTLLATALRQRFVDAVALARADFSTGAVGYRFDIVTDPDKITEYGTSAYFNIPIEKHWKEIDAYPGRVALCALPCHTSILRNRRDLGKALQNVELFISLFCGHNNEPELLRFVFRRQGIAESDVTDMRVDRTYLGGGIRIGLRDGSSTIIPFRQFNVYRSLWFFSKSMCRYCDDHLGGRSDLSIGDVFVREFRERDLKHSAVIARSEPGLRLMKFAMDHGIVVAEEIPPGTIYRAQKRVILPSADLASRHLACRITGFPSKKPAEGRFRLRSFLTYSLFNFNDRLSRTRWGAKFIGWIPKPLLYLYIASLKLINNTLRPTK